MTFKYKRPLILFAVLLGVLVADSSSQHFTKRPTIHALAAFAKIGAFAKKRPYVSDVIPPNVKCDHPNAVGDVFYKFDKIIIYFANVPSSPEGKPAPPAIFQSDSFIPRVAEIVRENFASCLKSETGAEKPIIVKQANYDGHNTVDLYDPRNVVLIVSLQYPYHPVGYRNDISTDAVLTVSPFRAGLEPVEAFKAAEATIFITVNPNSPWAQIIPGALERELDKALRLALRPYNNPMIFNTVIQSDLFVP